MDRYELKKWLRNNAVKPFIVDAIENVIKHNDLVRAINNGTFDKQPCDMCGYWENIINNGHNDDIKYCTQCGRKLEDTNHDN